MLDIKVGDVVSGKDMIAFLRANPTARFREKSAGGKAYVSNGVLVWEGPSGTIEGLQVRTWERSIIRWTRLPNPVLVTPAPAKGLEVIYVDMPIPGPSQLFLREWFTSPKPVQDLKKWRKDRPIYRGCIAYFPDSLMEVAHVSLIANEQHNPGQPMHWAFGRSMDHPDCEVRHMIDGEEVDDDGCLHLAKKAWRALADLQTFLEKRDPELHAKRQAQRDKQAKGG